MSDKKNKGVDAKTYKFDTLSLHAGYQPHKNAGSRQVPIYQTTSYLFDDVDHAAALFNLERGGHIYSRISNPTVAVLEERVASLEGGTAALATSSGMSAIFLTVMTLCEAGDHLVVSSQLYGGTVNLFRLTLPKFGIKCTFVKPRDTEGFKKAIQKNTKGIFGELVGNPENDFLPEIGSINKLSCSNNKGIRWDTGIATGDKVTPDYDPMLAKVIAIGETREQSARLLAKELRSTHLAGIKTNKDFLVQCLENNSFLKGKTTSDFIPREHKKLFKAVDKKLLDNAMKASALWLQEHNKRDNKKLHFLPRNWTNGILPKQDITFEFNDEEYKFQYENNNNHIQIHREHFERLSTSSALIISANEEHIHCEIDGIAIKAFISCFHDEITINSGSGDLVFKVLPKFIDPNEIIIEGSLTAPMPGKILNINVKKGSSVKTGETLLILEAMKMEHTIKANSDGQVIELYVKTGDQVESGSDLMKIE